MKTKILLEMGCNHQGNFEIAREMIDDAKKLGVWGVKFQKRDVESIPKSIREIKRDPAKSFGATYGEHREALEFNIKQIGQLKNYANIQGLEFVISVFDIVSAQQMIDLGVEWIKLPSQLYSNWEINRFLFENNKNNKNNKIIVSCGMHTNNEVINWPFFGRSYILFYCRSIYPCSLSDVNFNNFHLIKEALYRENFTFGGGSKCNAKLGYSSHDKNGEAIPYAVLLGAKWIERHYTKNKTWKGSDHGTVSSTFEEIKEIRDRIKKAELMLGEKNAGLSNAERKVKTVYRSPY